MTITMNHIETPPLPASTGEADGLLGILHDTVDAVAELDPDLLHSHTSAGHAVVTLVGPGGRRSPGHRTRERPAHGARRGRGA